MNSPNREEFEARLAEPDARQSSRLDAIDRLETRLAGVEASLGEVRQYLRGLKITIIVTGLSVVFGVAAINVSSMANLLAAFATGKETALAQASLSPQMQEIAATQAEMRRQSQETTALLREAGVLHRTQPPPK